MSRAKGCGYSAPWVLGGGGVIKWEIIDRFETCKEILSAVRTKESVPSLVV